MPTSALLRAEIEAVLARRIPSALTPAAQQIRPVAATGVDAIDRLLRGGLPVGALTEIVGEDCSGRTTLALSFLANVTRAQQVCAWVDVSDAFDPESAAASGIDLGRLLWVRCGEARREPATAASLPLFPPEAVAPLQQTRPTQGGGSHPRNEERGLDTAVAELMQRKSQFVRDKRVGTPGVPHLPLQTGEEESADFQRKGGERVEQLAFDRLPTRRGDQVLDSHNDSHNPYSARCAEPQRTPRRTKSAGEHSPLPLRSIPFPARATKRPQRPWGRLDQALRVTDLLLQAGGFGAIVLDLAGVAPEFAARIPLATWFRYRAAAERTRCSLILLTQITCAKSSAGVVLRLAQSQELPGMDSVLNGLRYSSELLRQRFVPQNEPRTEPLAGPFGESAAEEAAGPAAGQVQAFPPRKPPQSERRVEWQSRTPWSQPFSLPGSLQGSQPGSQPKSRHQLPGHSPARPQKTASRR